MPPWLCVTSCQQIIELDCVRIGAALEPDIDVASEHKWFDARRKRPNVSASSDKKVAVRAADPGRYTTSHSGVARGEGKRRKIVLKIIHMQIQIVSTCLPTKNKKILLLTRRTQHHIRGGAAAIQLHSYLRASPGFISDKLLSSCAK